MGHNDAVCSQDNRTDLMVSQLLGLSVRVWREAGEDVVLVFAEPNLEDMRRLLKWHPHILKLTERLLSGLETELDWKVELPEDEDDLKVGDSSTLDYSSHQIETDAIQDDLANCDTLISEDNIKMDVEEEDNEKTSLVVESKTKRSRKIPVTSAFTAAKSSKTESKDGFQCQYCDFKAETEMRVKAHENGVHLKLRCKQCNQVFRTADKMVSHTCSPRVYSCNKCEKTYRSKISLKEHVIYSHKGQKYKCEMCGVELSGGGILMDRHMKTVHGSQAKSYSCDHCSKTFKRLSYLNNHKKTHLITDTPHLCTYCGKKYMAKQSLMRHIDKVHKKLEPRQHVCNDCGKGFYTPSGLQCHLEHTHFIGEKTVCPLCGIEIIGTIKLKKHMARYHTPDYKYANCQICGETYPAAKMRNHVVAAHKASSYKFKCDICHAKFPNKPAIRGHIRKHTGARPYVCRDCDQAFVKIQSLQSHIRQHHNNDQSLGYYDVTRDINNPYAINAKGPTKDVNDSKEKTSLKDT